MLATPPSSQQTFGAFASPLTEAGREGSSKLAGGSRVDEEKDKRGVIYCDTNTQANSFHIKVRYFSLSVRTHMTNRRSDTELEMVFTCYVDNRLSLSAIRCSLWILY